MCGGSARGATSDGGTCGSATTPTMPAERGSHGANESWALLAVAAACARLWKRRHREHACCNGAVGQVCIIGVGRQYTYLLTQEAVTAFDSRNPRGITAWTDSDLLSLPGAEDDRFEYKSSLTGDGELSNKISRAASGFWNSGGGVFVAGVDGTGRPDGGLSATVGKQVRRDWADQVIARTEPRGPYAIATIAGTGEGAEFGIQLGKVSLVIGFGESYVGPHMAYDGKYYIRAGAHTVPASHYLVEAIRARRGVDIPMLRPLLRTKRHRHRVIELVVMAVSEAPALDVEITLDPIPPLFADVGKNPFPVRPKLIDRKNPLSLDVSLSAGPRAMADPFVVRLRYHDIVGRSYEEEFTVSLFEQMPIVHVGKSEAESLTDALTEIAKAIAGLK